MTGTIRLIIAAVLIIAGLAAICISVFGIFRHRYVLNRMQIAASVDTLGMLSCGIGCRWLTGLSMSTPKLILIVVFIWLTSPVSSHLISNLEASTNERLEDECEIMPLRELKEDDTDASV